jgi:hypothetical protein
VLSKELILKILCVFLKVKFFFCLELEKTKHSNTQPPADVVLMDILKITNNVAIVLPPFIKAEEFEGI